LLINSKNESVLLMHAFEASSQRRVQLVTEREWDLIGETDPEEGDGENEDDLDGDELDEEDEDDEFDDGLEGVVESDEEMISNRWQLDTLQSQPA